MKCLGHQPSNAEMKPVPKQCVWKLPADFCPVLVAFSFR